MKNRFGMSLALAFWVALVFNPSQQACSQIKVDTTLSPEQLVQEVLTGRGVRVRNVRYQGHPVAIGQLTHDEDLPIYKNAVILGTGQVSDFVGPNQRPKTSTVNYRPGTKDLYLLAGNRTFDAALLEFEFMADRDSISFNFMFASEEYNDYVGSTFGDAFAIVLSGPGFRNGINLATVPGSNAPININTVGFNQNRKLYVDNNPFTLAGKPNPQRRAELDQHLLQACEYDGMTRSISVGYKVQPKTAYKLQISIADAGDGQIDSAVLIEGKSLQSQEQYWRVVRRREIEAQRIADSIRVADSLAAVAAAELAAQMRADSLARLDSLDQSRDSVSPVDIEVPDIPEVPEEDDRPEVPQPPKTEVPVPNPAPKPTSGQAWQQYRTAVLPSDTEYKLLLPYQGDDYFLSEGDEEIVNRLAVWLKQHPDKKVGLFTPDGSANADLRFDIVRLDLIKAGVAPESLFRNGFSFLSGAQEQNAPRERLEIWVR